MMVNVTEIHEILLAGVTGLQLIKYNQIHYLSSNRSVDINCYCRHPHILRDLFRECYCHLLHVGSSDLD